MTPEQRKRYERILGMYRAGVSRSEIGRQFSICPQRVDQICMAQEAWEIKKEKSRKWTNAKLTVALYNIQRFTEAIRILQVHK
jgi:hypothetical protein